jgi:hypothetical protein
MAMLRLFGSRHSPGIDEALALGLERLVTAFSA